MITSMPVKPIIIKVKPPTRCKKCGGNIFRAENGGECLQCGMKYPFRVLKNPQEIIDAVNKKIEKTRQLTGAGPLPPRSWKHLKRPKLPGIEI